jgi:hypothetical protein
MHVTFAYHSDKLLARGPMVIVMIFKVMSADDGVGDDVVAAEA